MKPEKICLLIAAGISFFGALIHWIAPLMGVDWYMFLTSPQWVVQSAKTQTWPAPVGAVGVGGLMYLCGAYACSAAGLTRRIPFLRSALCTISTICVVRGALIFPLLIKVPQRLSAFDITASFVWLIAGICFTAGTAMRWKAIQRNSTHDCEGNSTKKIVPPSGLP